MKIERLEVWDWKGLEHVCLDDLGDGVNLVVGPNGAGKTRLFEALHAAFFERAKGMAEHKRKFQTRGTSKDPRVAVELVAGGVRWTLEKTFLKNASTRLEGGGAVLLDGDAEAKIRELMGTSKAGTKKATLDKMGLWPLVWVSQHQSHLSPSEHISDVAKGRLDDALGAEAGQVAAGPVGERVLQRVEAEYREYFTGKAGKPTGAYDRARQELDAARARLAEVEALRDETRQQAERLARDRDRLAELGEEMGQVRAELDEASKRRAAVEKLAGELENLEKEVAVRRLAFDKAQNEVERLEALEKDLAAKRSRRDDLLPKLEEAGGKLKTHEEWRARAERAVQELEERVAEARDALVRAEAQAKRAQARELVEKRRATLDEAEAVKASLTEVRERLARIAIDEEAFDELLALEKKESRARATLEAVAARLRVRALADTTLDGEPLAAGESSEQVVTSEHTFTLGEIAEVTIEPGGKDLSKRRDALKDAEEALAKALDRLALSTVAEARALLDERREREKEAARLEAELGVHAPEGIEPLRDEVGALEARLEELGDDDPAAGEVGAAQRAVDGAREELDTARAERDEASKALEKARGARTVLEHDREALEERIGELEAQLAALPAASALAAEAAGAKTKLGEAERRRDAVAAEVGERGAEDLVRLCDRLERALAKKEQERKLIKEEADKLTGALGRLDAESLHDAVQDAAADLDAASAEYDRLDRRARAARRLREVLLDAKQATQQAIWSTVTSRVEPYLARVLPGQKLRIEDGWWIAGVDDAAGTVEFDDLSGGIREQVALVVRFALAEALSAKEALPFVLDDPLVNTDPERLSRMIDILSQASKTLQLIVLSCNEPAYARMGEDRRFRLLPDGTVQAL